MTIRHCKLLSRSKSLCICKLVQREAVDLEVSPAMAKNGRYGKNSIYLTANFDLLVTGEFIC